MAVIPRSVNALQAHTVDTLVTRAGLSFLSKLGRLGEYQVRNLRHLLVRLAY
jgi:hypothetical protein